MKSTLYGLIRFILIFSLAAHLPAQAETPTAGSSPDLGSRSPFKIEYDIKSFDKVDDAVEQTNIILQKTQAADETLVISADSKEYLERLQQSSFLQQAPAKSTFVVFNDATRRMAHNSVQYFKTAYQNDKVGFVIATLTTAIETVVWVHVAPMSTLAISANIAYTVATAIYFRLNKDNWTNLTNQIKQPMRRFFNDTAELTPAKRMTYDYAANLTLSTVFALGRIPLMSMGQIIEQGISFGLFKMPLLMSVIGSAASFTWSEHLGRIDAAKQPLAKFASNRIAEIRSVVGTTLASTAALLNPDVFGLSPWVTLTVMGITGLVVYVNSNKINDWIEKNPLMKRFEKIIKMNDRRSESVFYCRNFFN